MQSGEKHEFRVEWIIMTSQRLKMRKKQIGFIIVRWKKLKLKVVSKVVSYNTLLSICFKHGRKWTWTLEKLRRLKRESFRWFHLMCAETLSKHLFINMSVNTQWPLYYHAHCNAIQYNCCSIQYTLMMLIMHRSWLYNAGLHNEEEVCHHSCYKSKYIK